MPALRAQCKNGGEVSGGVNDAPAPVMAGIGIAFGSGTNGAIELAAIILVKNNQLDGLNVVVLSWANCRKMIQNPTWATG